MIQRFSTFNRWKTYICPNQLIPLNFNQRLGSISLYLIFVLNKLLYPLPLLYHPSLPLILDALDQIQSLFPLLQLLLHGFLPVTAVVLPHLDVILIKSMFHVLMFFLRSEDTRLGRRFLTTLNNWSHCIISRRILILSDALKFRFKEG